MPTFGSILSSAALGGEFIYGKPDTTAVQYCAYAGASAENNAAYVKMADDTTDFSVSRLAGAADEWWHFDWLCYCEYASGGSAYPKHSQLVTGGGVVLADASMGDRTGAWHGPGGLHKIPATTTVTFKMRAWTPASENFNIHRTSAFILGVRVA